MAAVGGRRGRSPERVYVTPPADVLHCAVCLDVLSAPVSLPACGHTYCRACVASILAKPAAQRKCPTCRSDVSRGVVAAALPLNWLAKAQIDALRVRCRFGVKEEGDGWVADEAGCPAQLSLDGAAAHEATCGFTTTACPFAGCGVELRRSDVASHNAASMQAHLDGERAARMAGEAARLADAARVASSDARLAALEARFSAFEQCMPVGQMRSDGWALRKTIQAGEEQNEDEDDLAVWCCAFSPSSSMVCVALHDGALKLFDVASGDHRLTLEGHDDTVYCCAFSLDGSTIVSASDDKTIKLWNAASGAVIRTLEGLTHCLRCCAFSPDGRSICSGSTDKSLKLWDTATGECQRTLEGHTDWVRCCAYSADGATVLSGGDDKTLKLWSVATGARIRTFTCHTGFVTACCFSPTDGSTILSGSLDSMLKLWDATTGECRRTLAGHTAGVRGCAFSPIHGNLVLSCSYDLTMKLWSAATGACTATLEGHESYVYCCAVSPDGATITSGDDAGQLKLWRRA